MKRLSPWGRVLAIVATVAILLAAGGFIYSFGENALEALVLKTRVRQAAMRPVPLPCGPGATLQGTERQISVRAAEERLTVELQLVLPINHPCAQQAFAGLFADRLEFVTAAFGQIRIDYRKLAEDELGPLWVRREPKGSPVAQLRFKVVRPLRVRSAEFLMDRPASEIPPAVDRFTAAWEPALPVSIWSDILPNIQTSDRLAIEARSPRSINRLAFILGVPAPQSQPPLDKNETQQSYLRRLGQSLSFSFLSILLYGLGLSLPILLSVTHTRSAKAPSLPQSRLSEATSALLLFQLLTYLLIAFNDLWRSRLLLHGETTLTVWLRKVLHSPTVALPVGPGTSILICIVLGVLVPVLIRRRMGRASLWDRRTLPVLARGSLILVAAGLTISGSIGLAQKPRPMWIQGDPVILLILGFGIFLLTALFALLARLLGSGSAIVLTGASGTSRRPLGGLASACSLTLILLVGLDTLLRRKTWDSEWDFVPTLLWVVVTSIFGALLISSLLDILRSLGDGLPTLFPRLDQPGLRTLSKLALLFAAAPLPFFLSVDDYHVSASTLYHLALLLTQWVLPIWVIGIAAMLYRSGRASLNIDLAARSLGLLGIASVLFSPRIAWMYIPVTFLLGWWTLERLIVRTRQGPSLAAPYDGKELPRLLATVIDLNAALHAVRGHRRKQLGAMLKGEVDFQTYEKEREARLTKLASLRQQAMHKGQRAEDLILSFAPYNSAWTNGVHGAKWALFFSLPWFFLGCADLLRARVFPTNYPLWDFGEDIFLLALKWVSIGFFLGYFFPYLRGQSGLAKGLYIFLGLTLPTLPLAAILNSTPQDWSASCFWYLQTLIHCMLLGLFAFDNVVLRQGGQRDWRLLFEVHGLPAIGLSLSTLAVAIGAAITTLITSQIPGLVGLALRFALPQIDVPGSSGVPGSP